MILRRFVAAALCAGALTTAALTGAGCSEDSTEGEGVTNLEDVGPDIAKLEAELEANNPPLR